MRTLEKTVTSVTISICVTKRHEKRNEINARDACDARDAYPQSNTVSVTNGTRPSSARGLRIRPVGRQKTDRQLVITRKSLSFAAALNNHMGSSNHALSSLSPSVSTYSNVDGRLNARP